MGFCCSARLPHSYRAAARTSRRSACFFEWSGGDGASIRWSNSKKAWVGSPDRRRGHQHTGSGTGTGTQNSGASIEAGRYISKRIYVEAKQTTTVPANSRRMWI